MNVQIGLDALSFADQAVDMVSSLAPCSLLPAPCSLLPPLAFFSMPGGWEWVLILVVLLLLFGSRLPSVAKSFGKSIVEFKKGIRDVQDDIERSSSEPPRPVKPSEPVHSPPDKSID